jgi:hypothetical protein
MADITSTNDKPQVSPKSTSSKAWKYFKTAMKVIMILMIIWLFFAVSFTTALSSANSYVCFFTLPVFSAKVNKEVQDIATAINTINVRLGALDNKKMDILQPADLSIQKSDLTNDASKQSFTSKNQEKFTPNAYMNELQRFKNMSLDQQHEYLQMSQEDKRRKYQS